MTLGDSVAVGDLGLTLAHSG